MNATPNAAFGDREMMDDVLASQKFITENYNTFANECASPAVMTELMNILNEEHQIQHEIFDEMQKRGWYTVEQADMNKISQTKQKFQNQNS